MLVPATVEQPPITITHPKEKAKTPTAMLPTVEQPSTVTAAEGSNNAATATATAVTSAVAATAVASPAVAQAQAAGSNSAKNSPVPHAGSPLLYEITRMRETIV
jgi:hypothetical protein